MTKCIECKHLMKVYFGISKKTLFKREKAEDKIKGMAYE